MVEYLGLGFKPVFDAAFRRPSVRLNIDGLLLSQFPHAGRLHAKPLSPKKNHHKTPHKPPGDLVTPRKLSNSRVVGTLCFIWGRGIFLTHSKAFEHQLRLHTRRPVQHPTAPPGQAPQPQHLGDAVGRGNTTS